MGRKSKEFVGSIQVSNLALGLVADLVRNQTTTDDLEIVTDPVEARAHRIYRALGEQGLVPVAEVTEDTMKTVMREVVNISGSIANDEANMG